MRTGYSLEELYATLGEYPSESVTLFLDACFSGAKREGDMLASARGVAEVSDPYRYPILRYVLHMEVRNPEVTLPDKSSGHSMLRADCM